MKTQLITACLSLALLSACSDEGPGKSAPPSAPAEPAPTPPQPAPTAAAPAETPDATAAAIDAGAGVDARTTAAGPVDAGAAAATAGAAATADAGAATAAEGGTKTEIPTPDIKISKAKADIKKGEEIFAAKGCVACHRMDTRLVGPPLKGVTKRRSQEWLEKMILRPDIMAREDEVARKLLTEYLTPMPNQNVDPKTELPLILAYLKANE
ncbi:MAG TPA: cytochrome c [Aggregicoccus sp.]|nr:cytochrome c [Aggregicoccus sp.]